MLKFYDSNGRELCDVEREPGGKVDSYLRRASYLDDGSEVPEEELDFAAEGVCLCYECWEFS